MFFSPDNSRLTGAKDQTWELLLAKAPKCLSILNPTRSREAFGKALAKHFDTIREQLLRKPPSRSAWLRWIRDLVEFPS